MAGTRNIDDDSRRGRAIRERAESQAGESHAAGKRQGFAQHALFRALGLGLWRGACGRTGRGSDRHGGRDATTDRAILQSRLK